MRFSLTVIGILIASLAVAAEDKPSSKPIRVLIVTGDDHPSHNWKETSLAIRKILEKDRRFDARIVEDPEFLASNVVADYDVILLNFKNRAPLKREAEVRGNLVKLVKQGKGLVVIHFASGAFEDWPEFANLAGRVWDRKNTHDPRGPFTVKIALPQHPIVKGMHDFQADDELYTCLIGDRPLDVLATARSKVTGKEYPMAMAFEYGKGRVFHTPLGHDARALAVPEVSELIRRGCVWVADKAP